MTSATAEPPATNVPAAGFWLITLPDGTDALDSRVTVPIDNPPNDIAVVAAASTMFTTFGTPTGPVETINEIAEPVATLVPALGF